MTLHAKIQEREALFIQEFADDSGPYGWKDSSPGQVTAFNRTSSIELLQAVREVIKAMPSTCGRCEKKGVNTFGECKCSYEDSEFIRKSDLQSLLLDEINKIKE